MKRFLISILLLIAAFTIQNCVFPLMPFLSASPNLLLICTFSFGFIRGKEAGMLYGFLAGLLLDLFYSGPFGFYSLFYIVMGYLNGICTKYYYADYITLPLVLSVTNDLAYNLYIYIFRFLIRAKMDFPYYFWQIILPEIVFTTVTTLVVYRLILHLSRRMEAMEKRRDTTIV